MKITVFSKTGCPYCVESKRYLRQHNIPHDTVVIDDPAARNQFYDDLGLVGSNRFVPQIKVEDVDGSIRWIGGFQGPTGLEQSDLVARFSAGTFDAEF